jgi:hypothetical protein
MNCLDQQKISDSGEVALPASLELARARIGRGHSHPDELTPYTQAANAGSALNEARRVAWATLAQVRQSGRW